MLEIVYYVHLFYSSKSCLPHGSRTRHITGISAGSSVTGTLSLAGEETTETNLGSVVSSAVSPVSPNGTS